MSDGHVSDESQEIERLSEVIRDDVSKKRYCFAAIGVGDEVDDTVLAKLSVPNHPPMRVGSVNFSDFFRWISFPTAVGNETALPSKTNNYLPNPIDANDVDLPAELDQLVEQIAKNVHEVWAKNRLDQGWVYGEERSDALKQHPCLIPYEDLSEVEKAYDRDTAMSTLRLICKLGFRITPHDDKSVK
jgi:ryanodine receptor 2